MKRRQFLSTLSASAITLWPLFAHAGQNEIPVIGCLGIGPAGESASLMAAFRDGLRETGYVGGQNVEIEYHQANGNYERLTAIAADLVLRKVNLIAALGGPPAIRAAKQATSTIPIVFFSGADPVREGLVASFSRPGGNITGFSIQIDELTPKLLDLILELLPTARTVALLINPYRHQPGVVYVQKAARARGVTLPVLNASTAPEIDIAFAKLANLRADALIVTGDPFLRAQHEQIAALALRHLIPTICPWHEFTTSGGLISYGASFNDGFRQVGIYAGRILKGAKPADLPIAQPTEFELAINLKTAKALGLTVPSILLAQADEVIE
jgi:putative tryptophan/tyrosine transport system substrate-binding protein